MKYSGHNSWTPGCVVSGWPWNIFYFKAGWAALLFEIYKTPLRLSFLCHQVRYVSLQIYSKISRDIHSQRTLARFFLLEGVQNTCGLVEVTSKEKAIMRCRLNHLAIDQKLNCLRRHKDGSKSPTVRERQFLHFTQSMEISHQINLIGCISDVAHRQLS